MNEKIIKSIKSDIFEYIHTNQPARIIEFNHVEMTATVQLLGKFKIRGQEQVPKYIYRVPAGYSRSKNFAERIPLKKDDIVYLSFSEFDLEKILTSGLPESFIGDDKFDLNDAVIVTCISLKNQKMPDDNQNDWCIFNLKTGHKIIFKEDGTYEINAKKLIMNIDEEIEINTPIINALNSQFNVKSIKAESIITDTVNALKSAIIKGIDFLLHKHGGVTGGPSDTGGPK
ncbi:MAG: Gp138 family membrane-puncturing spike protein [Cetobacterium sp.]|uniref:Gp138 family membrane-puncturing spike protein n=1 Tax=Cetobacterium sp. TaxID=2071632 RepID=UPI003EE5BB71